MSWAALATRSGLSPTNRAPHGFCCSSKPSTSRPMASDVRVEVLVGDVLLVDALVMERLGLVLVMTGLLKSRRGPAGAPCGRVGSWAGGRSQSGGLGGITEVLSSSY